MTSFVERLDNLLYPGIGKNWDDRLFRERILARCTRHVVVLDLGAGAGILPDMNFRGHVARICGIDLDPRVQSNPMLDEGKLADAGQIPYADATFDLVFADNVVEHLADPVGVFREVHRVLKPGGAFLFKTPNKTHYMPLIARLTPHRFHQLVNKLRGRAEADTFPTLYRANSVGDIRRVSARSGFEILSIDRIEGRPEYMRLTWITYLLGAAYERVVNLTSALAMLRILLIGTLVKPGQTNTESR
ncbi:class I SAM-dependent methyltransferase [Parvibaculum sp.]|uniref:class I SAM-dependent methyltransferase n=1 Tax=Parvibaculum sp. TaxID=2024848 RepID=UPI003919BCEC